MKKLIFIFLLIFACNQYAMKAALSSYEQQMASMVAAYNKPVTSSKDVIRCFAQKQHENAVVITNKRLFLHICAQAARDKNCNVNYFRDLMRDINNQPDTVFEHPIKTKYVKPFHAILDYIPWNGETDSDCGVVSHETMMNDQFVNLGFSAGDNEVYIFANNEDDFDSEMDHREKIEQEFKDLLGNLPIK